MRREPDLITPELLNNLENVMHANECNVDHIMQYIVSNFARCFGTGARSQSQPQSQPQSHESN